MKKMHTLSRLTECGVVAVIRAETAEEAMRIAKACVDGGITGIEVTFTVPDAESVLRGLVSFYKDKRVVIGAGTVLDAVTSRMAILAGAQFVVSPAFDAETARLCNLYAIPYMPGCMTLTEMKQALEHGVDVIKVFPGNVFGPEFIKAIQAPLPQANLMPTGGVSLDNVTAWIQSGCVAVGVGGSLLTPAKFGDYEKITRLASQYIAKVREARGVLV